MLIDGFTVLAQVLNFVILVLLLKRFLYRPVLRAMAERKQRIEDAMARAKAAEREARRRAEALAAENRALADAKERLLAEAREEVRQWRENALEEVRREADGMRRSREDRLREEREAFLNRLKVQVAGQVVRISEKVLRDLADERLEDRLVAVLADRLLREEADLPVHDLSGEVTLQCGLALTPPRKAALYENVMAVFPRISRLSIEKNPELGLGLRLTAGDRKVEWNLARYLAEFEQGVLTALISSGREQE